MGNEFGHRPGYPNFTNLLFAVPMTGRPIPPDVMFAFHAMAMPMNYSTILQTVRGMNIDDARNHFSNIAEQANCKYIFMWDEDVACPPHTIPELIYKMEHHPEIGVCGGIYCLKREPAEPLVFRGNGNGPFWDWKAGEFFEVSGIGMGAALLRVEMLKDLKKPWFRTVSDHSKMLDGFASYESWTEDLWFCQRVADTGKWKVYADGSLLCTHYDMNMPCKGYNLPLDSKPVKHLTIPKGKKKILDIGSGSNPYKTNEGIVIKSDLDGVCDKTDYRADPRKLPFGTEMFDIVFSPSLDTFRAHEHEEVVKEWRRVLKNKGEMRLVVEDIENIAKGVLNKTLLPSTLYSGRKLSGFTFDSLSALLHKCEFTEVTRVKSDDLHIGIRAIK